LFLAILWNNFHRSFISSRLSPPNLSISAWATVKATTFSTITLHAARAQTSLRSYAALSGSFVPLLINDRVDVALASGADGVHVGWDDMPVADARRLLGREAIIGLSIKTRAQIEAAPLELLDYVCIGGVFETSSKDNREPPVRPDGFAALAAYVRARAPNIPVGAIAGIDETNTADVIAAGADGIAVISALSLARDPAQAAGLLRGLVDEGLRRRGAA
jgi:thiamine-phosphate pyrophosphorylase